MEACADWLLSLRIGSPRRCGPLSVWPLAGSEYLSPSVDDLDDRTMNQLFHESGVPVAPGRWRELVVNRGHRPVLVLQGQELATERYAFEVLAPRLARPGFLLALPATRREAEPEEEGPGSTDADGLLAQVAVRPEADTVGYLACAAGRFVRLELFPNARLYRARWCWALGSVARVAATAEVPPLPAVSPADPILRHLADACAGHRWEPEAEGAYRLWAAVPLALVGHVVFRAARPVYLDVVARQRAAHAAAVPRARRPVLEDAAALPLPIGEETGATWSLPDAGGRRRGSPGRLA
jgi:hypothetical protein